jgi:hypothetical protein
MEIELRDYDIVPGHMDDWLAGWRGGVMPLREQVGFRLVGAWIDSERDRVVWILAYDGPDGFDAADERYHAIPARAALDPEPTVFIKQARRTRVVALSPTMPTAVSVTRSATGRSTPP